MCSYGNVKKLEFFSVLLSVLANSVFKRLICVDDELRRIAFAASWTHAPSPWTGLIDSHILLESLWCVNLMEESRSLGCEWCIWSKKNRKSCVRNVSSKLFTRRYTSAGVFCGRRCRIEKRNWGFLQPSRVQGFLSISVKIFELMCRESYESCEEKFSQFFRNKSTAKQNFYTYIYAMLITCESPLGSGGCENECITHSELYKSRPEVTIAFWMK